jgi:hypothetical protein
LFCKLSSMVIAAIPDLHALSFIPMGDPRFRLLWSVF